jgi:phospholipid/cholesterol/gamma-HCH transport system ATP-binding protein
MFEGKNWWQGNKNEIVRTENLQVVDFVYASKFMKQIKEKLK